MKTLSKENLNQMANEMPSYERTNSGDYIYIKQNGKLVDGNYKFTGKETHVVVVPENPTDGNTGIAIEIPQGMQCKMQSGKDVNGKMGNWMVFNNTKAGDKKTYESEECFFKALSKATDVEWALASNSKTGGGKVFTSFESSGVNANPAYSGGYDTFIHNHGGSISESPMNSYDSGVWDYMRTHYEDYKFFGIYSEKDDDDYYY